MSATTVTFELGALENEPRTPLMRRVRQREETGVVLLHGRGNSWRCCMNTLWGWGRASWAGCGPDVRRGGQTLIMGYSADKSPLIGHLVGPLRRLEPLGAQRQEKCGPNRPTPTGYSCNNAGQRRVAFQRRVAAYLVGGGQTPGATQRCLNPGFSERIGNSRRTAD